MDAITRLLLLQPVASHAPTSATPHPNYAAWTCASASGVDASTLRAALADRPAGLYRLKGAVEDRTGALWEVQVVGRQIEVTPATGTAAPTLVGIGLSDRLDLAEVDAWWAGVTGG